MLVITERRLVLESKDCPLVSPYGIYVSAIIQKVFHSVIVVVWCSISSSEPITKSKCDSCLCFYCFDCLETEKRQDCLKGRALFKVTKSTPNQVLCLLVNFQLGTYFLNE